MSIRSLLISLAFASAALGAIKTGPSVGAQLPDFTLVDQDNRSHTLSSLMGPKGAVVVVYRSADW